MSNRIGNNRQKVSSGTAETDKVDSGSGSNQIDKSVSWIEKIGNKIKDLFTLTARQPLKALPPMLLLCEAVDRPGLSAIALTGAILHRLSEAGIPTEPNPDGTENKTNQFVKIICEEFVKEIKNNMKVSVALESGSCFVAGTAVGPTGTMAVTATNVAPISGNGIAQ